MFRLFKLASYALLGYALFEFFRGLTGDVRPAGPMARSGVSSENTPRGEAEQRSRQRMTEKGQTQETDGGSSSYPIGRGVVHR